MSSVKNDINIPVARLEGGPYRPKHRVKNCENCTSF